MRLLFSIILIALLSYILEYFFPWWTITIAAFIITFLFNLKQGKAFLAGFSGVFSLWLSVALFIDFKNEHILSQRMAQLFHLPNSILFIIVAAMLGGIVGGLSGWSGAAVRRVFKK